MEEYDVKCGFGSTVFLIFLILKLVGVISWSWWWVTAPIWIPCIFYILIVLIILAYKELD